MNCPGENTLLDFLGGGTDEVARAQLSEHVAGCDMCRLLLEDARGEASRTLSEDSTLSGDGPGPSKGSTSAVQDPLINQRIGDYQVIERIGSGGMGVVYRGIQPIIGKVVAIKVIRATTHEDEGLIQRMLLEARAVNAIGHRGIVDIFGFGQLPNGRHYVVMEYLQGAPLDVWLREQGPLAVDELIALLDEILLPLGAAHSAGVVHRDLKPSNLFVVLHSDGARHIKLLDFGLAKRTVQDQGLTRPGLVLGTPAYMAPEQVRGQEVDARADLYSFAVLAYKMATGERPFQENDALGQMEAHVSGRPRPLRELRPELPEALEKLLLKLLEKDPAARPASVKEVRQQLRSLRPPDAVSSPSTPVVASTPAAEAAAVLDARSDTVPDFPATGIPNASMGVPLKRWGLALALVLVLALGGGALFTLNASRASSAREQGTAELIPAIPEDMRFDGSEFGAAPREEALDAKPAPSEALEPEKPAAKTAVKTAVKTVAKSKVQTPPRVSRRTAPRPTLESSRRALLARIDTLQAKLKGEASGGEPDVLSTMFLEKAAADARKARSVEELRGAERTIQGVERRFLAAER